MVTENRAEFVIALDGDDGGIRAIFNAFKNTVKSGAAELEKTTSDIQLFRGLKANLDTAAASVTATTAALAKLRDQAKATQDAGENIGKDLSTNLRDAERAAASATKEFDKQQAAISRMSKSLTSAGVDIKSLASEEIRLSTAAKQAAEAEQNRAAASTLGIKLSKDVTAEIQKQVQAFNTLRTSGAASSQDLANAQKALAINTAKATESLKTGSTLARDFGSTVTTSLAGAAAQFLGLATVIATVASAFKSALTASLDFSDSVAKIGTVTNLSKDQLAQLGDGVRQVALAVGVDLKQSLDATFELLRSGVSQDNVLSVLKTSAEAAKAAFVDVGVGAKAANVLLDSFGADAADLPALFDKIAVGSHNGGASLKEFADNAGGLLNVARSTGQSFDSVLATLSVLVNKSGDATKSFTDLTKILATLGTSSARENLRALGITSTDVVEIFSQLGAQGKSLNEVLGLELSSGGAKAAAAIATLTNNSGELPDKFAKISGSAGQVSKDLAGLFDTPTARAARFNAELEETKLSIGNLFGGGSRVAQLATAFLHQFNQIGASFDNATIAAKQTDASFLSVASAFLTMDPAAEVAAAALSNVTVATDAAAKSAAAVNVILNATRAGLAEFGKSLLEGIKATQDALSRDLADIQTRADAQVAALDRSKAAESATATATLAIQLKAAQDKFALIQTSEQKITDATNAAIAARAKAQRAAGADDQKQTNETNAIKLAAVSQTLAAYQSLYSSLIALAQTAAARIQTFELARVDIARQVETELRNIRLESLSGLDQYIARNAEVDRLISEGRKKATQGDVEGAKQFFQQAIEQAKGLSEVVDASGVKVISSTQAQADKITALKKVQDASNQAFGDQAAAAKAGADATIAEANRVGAKVTDLQGQLDALKATLAAGVSLKVTTDEASIAKALATLDELTKPRTVTITVQTVGQDGKPAPNFVGPPSPFRSGGIVRGRRGAGPVVRGFARGGAVFNRPSWLKVPGTGSGDTVPAALQAGSYVVRKSASRYYGDGIMGALARGAGVRRFAAGGVVTKDDISDWARKQFGWDPFPLTKPAAGGGGGGSPVSAPAIDPKKGFKSGDSFQSKDPPISFDTRPIPAELITAVNVISYAKEMLQAVGQTNPMLGSLLPEILNGIKAVENNPLDEKALTALLQSAETIGSNPYIFDMWGLTAGHQSARKPEWFVDWLELHGLLTGATGGGSVSIDESSVAKRMFERAISAIGAPPRSPIAGTKPGQTAIRNPFARFAGGGDVDTVPAMLTPGEWVIRKPAVNRYGSRFMHAVNSMAIPPGILARMMAPPMPVSRYETGGAVGSASGSTTAVPLQSSGPGAGATATININANAGDLLSETNVRRFIVPVIRDVLKASG